MACVNAVLACGLLFFVSCSQHKAERWQKQKQVDYRPRIDVLLNAKGDTNRSYRWIQKAASQISLDPLQKGFDSLQLRVWCNYSFYSEEKVFIFKKVGDAYSAELIQYVVESSDTFSRRKVIETKPKNLKPVNSFRYFLQRLTQLNIDTLPHADKIPEYGWGLEGNTYSIEWATKKDYRFLTYINPEFNTKLVPAQKVISLLNLIEAEFGEKIFFDGSKEEVPY